ncbi:hypothetical protein ACFLWR_02325 [Chloroflexota bacterium]
MVIVDILKNVSMSSKKAGYRSFTVFFGVSPSPYKEIRIKRVRIVEIKNDLNNWIAEGKNCTDFL